MRKSSAYLSLHITLVVNIIAKRVILNFGAKILPDENPVDTQGVLTAAVQTSNVLVVQIECGTNAGQK